MNKGTAKRTDTELKYINVLNVLNDIDMQLRTAQQIIYEFNDDLSFFDSSDCPNMYDFIQCTSVDEFMKLRGSTLIYEFPRYATLLEVAVRYICEAHKNVIEALVKCGERADDSTYIISK